MKPGRLLSAAWSSRWGAVRLLIAIAALWFLLADAGARLARLQLAALPTFDYAAEVRHLCQMERYAEAIMVADDGLGVLEGPAREELVRERENAESQRASLLRRTRDFGLGALSGQGGSLERVAGAVTADLFVVGDVRDLAIQGAHYVADGEADTLIVLLSGIGLATTLAPSIDAVPALLKVARKTGAMTAAMGERLIDLLRKRRTEELGVVLADVAVISRRASPAGTLRVLRHVDDPADLARLARFVERAPGGAFALHVTGKEGASLIKSAPADAIKATDAVVVAAARKGAAGTEWLRRRGYRRLLRPHPAVGVVKSVYKGNAQELVSRAIAATDGRSWWLIPLFAAWALVESALIAHRFAPRRLSSPAPPAGRLAPA
ncbi:MAG: hypothetical protein KF745_09840 [Phycisphaeraceae bacterium]|nr:hypothetical protein [Phycisphaeraceae bacterium]